MDSTANELKEMAGIVLERLSDFLSQSQSGNTKVLIQRPPAEVADNLELEKFIRNGTLSAGNIDELLSKYLDNTQHLHHPQFIGHQAAAPHVASSISDMIHGVVNNPMAIYEMGPAAAVMEKVVINWMLEKVGWFGAEKLSETDPRKTGGGGILTHGGSMANLTAMLAARAKADPDAWTDGTSNDLVVMGPEVSHYSISRAISIMGMGSKAMVPIKVNEQEVLDPDNLYPVYNRLKEEGKRVMAVIANGCATSTGLYDPIEEVGQFCRENDLWYHVDGAHGAVALLSPKEKHLLKGVELADSLTWDAHKMLQTSALCAAVLVKDHKNLDNTFRQKGSYIFFEKEQLGIDSISNAIECTKSGLGTKLFWALAGEGEEGMKQFIEGRYNVTKDFYELIQAHPDFECPCYPESNILCFRYTKYGLDNSFQLALRNELVKRGDFYITTAVVNGERYLRLSVMNKHTAVENIQKLMDEVEGIAEELSKKGN
ncbi:diaminobutyrate decarboxylase [Leptobacterium flavescens]|uniref:Diaminobutyrate decarboxylase n=1 Tax=Leptobacterium flavescens TaxID=472055 RepID=A0A6P0UPH2_9FLAO|nr:pyridoxal-dependent decarboxylase [Leptobacterium flavescens]NER15224.1 diaminobutyrate decarboxylase [Leptobacterium flavescens]